MTNYHIGLRGTTSVHAWAAENSRNKAVIKSLSAARCNSRTALLRARVFCGMRIAECGKLSRGNLRKIKCGTFRKLPRRFSAFRSRKIPHFRGSQNYRSFALHNRFATDAYHPMVPWKWKKNEKWFIGYSSSMLDCTSNKTLKQEHTIQNYNIPVTHNIQ